jgi:hypothetical protein
MSDKLMITVHIPCKPHVKKYLAARYGQQHTMSKKSLIGTLLFHILEKQTPPADWNRTEYETKYDILIPEYYFKNRGHSIGYKKKHYLALCFEKIFFEDMMLSIDYAQSEFNVKPIEAMRRFLKKYGINENDVNFDSVYRQYQREKFAKKAA